MVRKPGKHQKSEQRCQDLGWKVHDRANLLFCAHTLCMNYVTNTFLLVSSLVRSKQLLYFLHGQGQKSEQKPTTKKFVEFHNHSPLLTMIQFLSNGVNYVCTLVSDKNQSISVRAIYNYRKIWAITSFTRFV